MTTLDEAS